MKKLVILHPPFYPVNYGFYHELGKLVEVCVFMFGDCPSENPDWQVQDLYQPEQYSFRLKLFGRGSYPKIQVYSGRFLFDLRKEAPDAVLTIAFAPYGIYAALFQKLLGYRFYVVSDANSDSEGQLSQLQRGCCSWLRQRSRSWLLSKCHKAISASPATSDYLKTLQTQLQIEEALQTADVPYFLEQSQPYDQAERRSALRSELGQQIWRQKTRGREQSHQEPAFVRQFCDSSIWLGVGRLIRRKRWHWGLTLLLQNPQLQYVLVGKGELEQELLQEAERLGVQRRFHLLPFVPPQQLARYYNAADVFYFPPMGEPFGFVVPEALASGCPVLCSDQIGASVFVQLGINGWHGVEGPNGNGLLEPRQVARIMAAAASTQSMRKRCKDSIKDCTPAHRARQFCQIMELES